MRRITKEWNEMWRMQEYYVEWNDKKIQVSQNPPDRIKIRTTLQKVMDEMKIPKDYSLRMAEKKYPLIKKIREMLETLKEEK